MPCGEGEGTCVEPWSCTEIPQGCPDGPMMGCDPDDEECATPDDVDDCDPNATMSFCTPPWYGPCDTDENCGARFTCEAREICSCDDSPPTYDDSGESEGPESEEGSSSDALSEDNDDECMCAPSEDKRCYPEEIPCDDDTSCPDEWTCTEAPSPPVACTVDSDGTEECEEEPPLDGPQYCLPEHWKLLGDGHGDGYGDGQSNAGASEDGYHEDDEVLADPDAEENAVLNIFEGCQGAPTPLLTLLLGLGLFLGRRRRQMRN
jgi:MYXO-CTERM domain-containing protein